MILWFYVSTSHSNKKLYTGWIVSEGTETSNTSSGLVHRHHFVYRCKHKQRSLSIEHLLLYMYVWKYIHMHISVCICVNDNIEHLKATNKREPQSNETFMGNELRHCQIHNSSVTVDCFLCYLNIKILIMAICTVL